MKLREINQLAQDRSTDNGRAKVWTLVSLISLCVLLV